MNTRRPLCIRIMPRTARLATRYAPVRLVSITEVKSSSLISASNWSWVIPALATSTSTGPCAASTSAKALSTADASLTSHATVASPATASPERDVTVTRSPPAASRRAMASPMPRFPPVTRVDRVIGAGTSRALRAGVGNPRERTRPGVRPGREHPAGRQARPKKVWDRLPFVDESADSSGPARIDPEFTAYPLSDLADAALQRAADLGAGHADFRAERVKGQRIGLSDGNLETLFDADELGLAVRVVVDGTWGFAAAVDLTTEAAARAAEEAVDVARVAAAINTERIELADEPGYGDVSWVSSYEIDPFSVNVAEKVALLAEWSTGLLAHDRIDHVDASLYQVKECKYYSDGVTTATQQRVRLHPTVTAVALEESGRFETMRTLAPPAGRGHEYLTGGPISAELAELPGLLAEKLAAPPVQAGHYDLVIDPSNLWLTIHESIGHATELDRALGYEAAYAGTSFATLDK